MAMHVSKDTRDKLSKWDMQLACITEKQKEGVMEMSAAATFRPLPVEIPLGICLGQDNTEVGEEPKIKVESVQQLNSWFDEVELEVHFEEERSYREYSKQLQNYSQQSQTLLTEVNKALELLEEMCEKHQSVSMKTGALYEACEKLVEDQTKLTNVAESITEKLSYFSELEKIGGKLNTPTLSATSDSFVGILARLDECIGFIENHSHYKESLTYLLRFKHYQSKALGFVKQHVVHTLRHTTQSVLPKQGEVLSENSYAQFYGKFRTSAPKIKMLMREIELRTEKAFEYATLLHDCHQCYVSQRALLLSPTVNATIEELKKIHGTNYSGLVRAGCNFLSRVCQDEYQLFFHFFTDNSSSLSGLLEMMCYSLYDALRPVVIHINHLETLADMCSILQVPIEGSSTLMYYQQKLMSGKNCQVEILEDRVKEKENELATFGMIITQLLEDVKQRLVFRAERYIYSDIRNYVPAPGDLAYPEKLTIAADAQQLENTSDSDSVFNTSEVEDDESAPRKQKPRRTRAVVDMQAMWYPTLRRSLVCLSKLYRCLDKPVFEGLAQDALNECVASLQSASASIQSKKTQLDGQLFLIKHLLILREQIAAFDVDFCVTDVRLDFSKTKAAAFGLLKKKSRIFSLGGNNAFLEFFLEGIPEVVESQLDSKREVDAKLKLVCEQLISQVSSSLTLPLKRLVTKFEVIQELAVKDGIDMKSLLRRQPFSKADEVHDILLEANKLLKSQVPLIQRSLTLYLANEETEHILFRPIKASVLQMYEELEKIVHQFYSVEDQQIISIPSQDQVSLMLTMDISTRQN